MNDTLLNDDVRDKDLGRIDKDVITFDGDVDRLVGKGRQGHVLEVGAVCNHIGDEMIGQNARQFRDGGVGEDVCDGLEGRVVGDEGGQVRGEGAMGDVRSLESTGCCGLVERDEGGGDVLGEG